MPSSRLTPFFRFIGNPFSFLLLSSLITATAASKNTTYQPRPYTIDVSPKFLEETRQKVANFRPTIDIDQTPWFDGPPVTNVTEIQKYWVEEYDWFAYQSYLNSNFSHYITTVPPPGGTYNRSLDIHFIHQRSTRDDAIPLLMLHGWPSTSVEWEKVIPGLADPDDASKPAFHVVAPDLPGFGFSPAPTAPGLGLVEHGTVFTSLMEQLGYDRFAVYSTDLGYFVALHLIKKYEARIINHLTDFYIIFPTDADLARYHANETTLEENNYIEAAQAFINKHAGYSMVHSTYPLSLAYALTDSPLGFLAWMWQLAATVNDRPYEPSELITHALMLWIPGVYGNIRSYKELFTQGPPPKTEVPTSIYQFGGMSLYPELSDFNYVVSTDLCDSHFLH